MIKVICKNTNEVCFTYQQYLNSLHWKDVKARYRKSKLFKNKCYCCWEKNIPLSIHHKSYKFLGNEPLNHLIALCQNCHEYIHNQLLKNTSNKVTLWNIAKKIRRKMGNYVNPARRRKFNYIQYKKMIKNILPKDHRLLHNPPYIPPK